MFDTIKVIGLVIERRGAIRGLPGAWALDPEPLRLGQVTPTMVVVPLDVPNLADSSVLICYLVVGSVVGRKYIIILYCLKTGT